MDKEKKKWETPKLICLYRGRPEEAVLGYCKIVDQSPGPGSKCGMKNDGRPCEASSAS